MNVLIAGGVYRLSAAERTRLQPAPEEVLAEGLRELGVTVTTTDLKDFGKAAAAEYDVIHVHHMSKLAVVVALRSPGRCVFTHHASTYSDGLVRRWAESIVWRRARAVIALSRREASEKKLRFPYLQGRLHVVPNGVPAVGEINRRIYPSGGAPFRVGLVAKLNANKRPDLAVRALVNLPSNVTLELSYHQDSPLEEELRYLVTSLGLFDRVKFLGQASGDDLARRYERTNLLLLTSKYEALPSVVYEALMTGCPVVATDVGGVAEQVGDAGVLVPPNTKDYAPYIMRAMGEYDSLAGKAFNRGQKLRARLSPDTMARQHLQIYTQIAERKS